MRLDKYLKVSRLIKRRTVANEACDAGKVLVNGEEYEAKYRNGFLDRGVDVVVVEIEGNVLVVERN